jgi:hypothetical protein
MEEGEEMVPGRLDRLPFPKLWLTLGVFALVLLTYATLRPLFGGEGAPLGLLRDVQRLGESQEHLVVALLIAFTLANHLRTPADLQRHLRALRPLLPGDAGPSAGEILSSVARLPREIVTVAAGLFGVAIIPAFRGGAGFTPALAGGEFDLAWSVAANFVLFALMGRLAYTAISLQAVLDERVTPEIQVDLLDQRPLAPYARRGLRSALYWLVGSSIASLLFLRFGFLWLHVFIVIGTLGVGVFVMLYSLKGVHRRLDAEKRRELAALVPAIRRARGGALGDGPAAVDAAARLPGLLALESRIEGASTWPFDVSTFLRFSALGLLAIGSWLGGAVIERLLGLAVD